MLTSPADRLHMTGLGRVIMQFAPRVGTDDRQASARSLLRLLGSDIENE